MNDELPELFARLTPRAPDEALRGSVLAAVAQELSLHKPQHKPQQEPEQESKKRRVRWERICEWSVAAALVLGIGLNVWQQTADEAWQTRLYGPAPVSRVARGIAQSETDATRGPTGSKGQRRLSDARPPLRSADPWQSQRYERLIHQFHDLKSSADL